jgi:hypothetical protein
VVAAIIGGRPGASPGTGDAAGGSAEPAGPSAQAPATAASSAAPTDEPALIVLLRPPRDHALITSQDIEVSGYLASGTGPVLAVLETAEGEWLAGRSVGPMTLGRPGDDPMPRFALTLTLPDPRPLGPLVVRVIAFDLDGDPLETRGRPIVIGEIVRREIGEDGLMGGLPFETAP